MAEEQEHPEKELQNQDPAAPSPSLTRRAFLASAATAVGLVVTVNCAPLENTSPPPPPTPVITLDDKYLHVPPAPSLPPTTYQFFTPEEARTLEAFVGRLLPGTPSDPGAREAGVALFIDNLLATTQGFIEPTYINPPFAKAFEGDTPPPDEPGTIWVQKEELARYGFQMPYSPQEIYRMGLENTNKLARAMFGSAFADMDENDQDALLAQMAGDSDLGGDSGAGAEGGNVQGFGALTAQAFFEYVHKHVIHGMFGDPLYGGNRDFAGWKLVGYPGAQRAYTESDLKNENFAVAPQGLAQLDPLHPGHRTRPEIILPVQSGQETR